MSGRLLVLDISGSRALLARADGAGGLGEVREVANEAHDAAVYWPAVLAAARELGAGAEAVGVSFGGPVDRAGRVVSVHVPGWAGIDVGAGLAEATGCPVRVENDANCGALGEFHHGGWGELHTLVFMTCSTGIGAGIVSGGQLFRGARGLAGEVGHNTVDPQGALCVCGSIGCLEVQASGTAIARRGGEAGAKAVFDRAAAGDDAARQTLAEVFADFGRGIAAVQHAYDPDLITIGGGVSLAGRALTEPVATEARHWLMRERRDHLRLESAALGLHSQLHGAAALWRND